MEIAECRELTVSAGSRLSLPGGVGRCRPGSSETIFVDIASENTGLAPLTIDPKEDPLKVNVDAIKINPVPAQGKDVVKEINDFLGDNGDPDSIEVLSTQAVEELQNHVKEPDSLVKKNSKERKEEKEKVKERKEEKEKIKEGRRRRKSLKRERRV